MDELMTIMCPGDNCDATFEVPMTLGGELGECTECDTIFEIPQVEGMEKKENLGNTDTGAIKTVAADDQNATNTVKLSRSSIGMVPDIKDNFNFDVVEKASGSKAKENTGKTRTGGKKFSGGRTSTGVGKSRRAKAPQKKKTNLTPLWIGIAVVILGVVGFVLYSKGMLNDIL